MNDFRSFHTLFLTIHSTRLTPKHSNVSELRHIITDKLLLRFHNVGGVIFATP